VTGRGAAPPPLAAALSRLGVEAGSLSRWERVVGGLANTTWRVVLADGAELAVQVPGGGARTCGIDRETCLDLCRAASAAGVTPEVLVAEDGVLVQRWVHVRRRPDELDPRLIVPVLRRLHALDQRLPDRSSEHWLDRYRLDLLAVGSSVAGVLGAPCAAAVEASVTALRADPRPQATCHNDLVPENVLVTAEGVYLIDFEWAGAAEPLSDVAGLWSYTGAGVADLDSLVDLYLGERRAGDRLRARRLALLRHAVDALWLALRGEDPASSVAAAAALADEVVV
jgi:hypothetical protein